MRHIGLFLSLAAGLIGWYEALALLSPRVPTISRMMQGLRDGGHPMVVFAISAVIVCILALFGAWLYYHLNYQVRSGS